jgi:NitT/TauT family transport system permease protein
MEVRRSAPDLRGLAFLMALGVLWWTVTGPLHLIPEFVFPSPRAVWQSFLRLASLQTGAGGMLLGYKFNLWEQIGYSVARLLLAFLIAAAIAIPLGALMGRFQTMDDLLDPTVQSLRPIPPIAWTPLAILWFGIGLRPILFIIVLGAVWPILLHTISGMRQARPILLRAGQSLGASQLQIFLRIVLPSALPFTFTGVRTGLTVGWWMIVPAEMIASDNGLGFLIMRERENGHIDDVFTGILAIALVGYGLSLALSRLARLRLFGG